MAEDVEIVIKATDKSKAGFDSAKGNIGGLEKAMGGLDAAGAGLRQWGGGLTAAVTLPLAGIATGVMAVWSSWDAASDGLRAATGASGAALTAMEDTVKNLSTTTAGLDLNMEGLAEVVGQLNVGLDLTGPTLEAVAQQVADFSRLTGTDAVSNTELLTGAVNAWGIESSEVAGMLDSLFVATQQTGVGSDALMTELAAAAPIMSEYGLGWEETSAMIGAAHQQGLDWSSVAGAMKIGMGKLTETGKPLGEAFQDVKDAFFAAGTETEKLTVLQDTFGSRGSAVMKAWLENANKSVDGVMDAMGEASGGIAETSEATLDWNDQLALLWNEIKVEMIPLGEEMAAMLKDMMPFFKELIEKVKGAFEWFSELDPGMKRNIIVIAGLVAAIGPLLLVLGTVFSVISTVIGVFSALVPIVTAVGTVFATIAGIIGAPVIGIIAIIAAVIAIIYALVKVWQEDLFGIKTKTQEFIKSVGTFFSDGWKHISDGVKDFLGGIKDKITDTIKGIGEWFSKFPFLDMGKDIINGIIDGVKKGVSALGDAVKDAARHALDAAKNFLGIHSPSIVAAKEIGIPFAQGIGAGIATGLPTAMRSVTNNNYFNIELVGGQSAGQDVFSSVQLLSALYG